MYKSISVGSFEKDKAEFPNQTNIEKVNCFVFLQLIID